MHPDASFPLSSGPILTPGLRRTGVRRDGMRVMPVWLSAASAGVDGRDGEVGADCGQCEEDGGPE